MQIHNEDFVDIVRQTDRRRYANGLKIDRESAGRKAAARGWDAGVLAGHYVLRRTNIAARWLTGAKP
jgi:hypothetical protein